VGTSSLHTYPTPGIYQISIFPDNGLIPSWEFQVGYPGTSPYDRGSDRLKFISIDEWGGYRPRPNDEFRGCYNLKFDNVIDTPNLNGRTSLKLFYNAFSGETEINNIGSWDVTDIQDLSSFLKENDLTPTAAALTTESYNQLLIGWASYGASLQNGVVMEMSSSTYSGATATAAKNYLTTTKSWDIYDGGPV
jgi:hypothetical protein